MVTLRFFGVRGRELTERQQEAVELIKKGCSQRVAAERIGISERTITRWKRRNLIFRQAVEQARAGGRS